MAEPTSIAGGSSPIRSDGDSERWFRAVADYTYDWESWIDPSGQTVWINRAVERLTGYTVAECLAMPEYPLPIVARADRRRMRDLFASALAGTSGNDVEFRICHKLGETCWMAVSWQPIFDDAGRPLGYRASIRDIQQRKAAEEALRRSEQRYRKMEETVREHANALEQLVRERTQDVLRLEEQRAQMAKLAALGELAAGVAHEINNPLAGIKNAFRLIRDQERDSEQQELLKLIDSEIERMSGIVRQMYNLYRYRPQRCSEFDLGAAVKQVCKLLDAFAATHRLQIEPTLPAAGAPVTLPEGEVKQVLYNLVCNAIEASSDGGRIDITVVQEGASSTVTVHDHGSGIAPDVLPHIFEPFFSTKKGTSQSGLGLGLSVSSNLIAAMGGSIEASSTPGEGTTFTARFPNILVL
jgi:PAS domain S-box-containing protein